MEVLKTKSETETETQRDEDHGARNEIETARHRDRDHGARKGQRDIERRRSWRQKGTERQRWTEMEPDAVNKDRE